MGYILVGIGGIFGSLTRYILWIKISQTSKSTLPFNTFIINITGAVLLGIVAALEMESTLYLFLAEGFLGAYTTFSTFMYEGFRLFQRNDTLNALIYISSSLIIGLMGFIIGFESIRLLK